MSIEQLRDILFEEDRARMQTLAEELEQVRAKVANKEALLASLNPVIADLLERKIANSGEEMAEIVAPLMGPAIKKQVAESKEEVVEALYPVIGQTVRRAVAEAMRKLVQQINQRLEKSFNLQNSWRRLKAKVLGLPEPLVVLPQVFPFVVEQLFLIDQRTGLLVAHTTAADHDARNGKTNHDEKIAGKPQMVSGMLTAIQDFTRDAFGSNETGDLHEVKYGDKMIFVASSPPVFLAAVTLGAAPLQFPDRLRGLLRRVHNNYYRELREFNGDPAPLAKAREPMYKFITAAQTVTAASAKTSAPAAASPQSTFGKVALGIALGLGLALGAWFLFGPATEKGREKLPPAPVVMIAPVSSQLRLEARFEGKVWLQAITDARDTTEFTFQKGEAYAWRADSLFNLRIGNIGETRLFLNGRWQQIDGAKNEVVDATLTAHGIVNLERAANRN